MPMSAGRDRLTVEDREVDAAGVHLLDDDRLGGHLDELQLGQVRVRAVAERQDHLLAGVDVVAVDEDLQGRRRLGWSRG